MPGPKGFKMQNSEVAKRRVEAVARGVGMQTQIYADRALNAEIWDIEGNRYIDFAAGIAVVNTGHCHPKVMAAVAEQMGRFTHAAAALLEASLLFYRAAFRKASSRGLQSSISSPPR